MNKCVQTPDACLGDGPGAAGLPAGAEPSRFIARLGPVLDVAGVGGGHSFSPPLQFVKRLIFFPVGLQLSEGSGATR